MATKKATVAKRKPGMSALTYIRPTSLDTPQVGVLYQARAGKKRAAARLRLLRAQKRHAGLGGNFAALQLACIKAETSLAEWKRMERGALEALERRANELGKTTIRTKASQP